MVIRGKNLEKEKEEALDEIFAQVVHAYAKYDNSRGTSVETLESMTKFITDIYQVYLVAVNEGSIVINVKCPTLDSLDHLWSDYVFGHLDKVAERYLVTDEIRKKLNLETICLKTTIEEENYLNCRKAVIKMQSTDSGEYNKTFGKYSYVVHVDVLAWPFSLTINK